MSTETWNVILGGAIVAVAGLATQIVAAVIQYYQWKREREEERQQWQREKEAQHLQWQREIQVDQLQQRINNLHKLSLQGVALINEFEKGNLTGMSLETGVGSLLILTSMSPDSALLWHEVLKAAVEKQQNRTDIYSQWVKSIGVDIIHTTTQIEILSKIPGAFRK